MDWTIIGYIAESRYLLSAADLMAAYCFKTTDDHFEHVSNNLPRS